jgi:cyclophilin family peptidyl-prolyl cis-trans isomerase
LWARSTIFIFNYWYTGVLKALFIVYNFAGKYTVFGHVIDGMDTLDKMERIPTGANDRPLQEVRIQRITIHANPLAN